MIKPQIANTLKFRYLDIIKRVLDKQANLLLSAIEITSEGIFGKDIKITHLSKEENKEVQFVSELKNFYGESPIIETGKSASPFTLGLQGLFDTNKFNLSRTLYSDGSGRLSGIETIKGDKSYAVDTIGNLIEELAVDIYDGNGNRTHSGLVISKIDRRNKSIDFYNILQPVLPNSAMYSQSAKDKELTGLGAIFSNSEKLYGVNRETTSLMRPYITTTDKKVSSALLDEFIEKIEKRGNSNINYIVCSADVRNAYMNDMAQNNRDVETIELGDGYRSFGHNGIPLLCDKFMPESTIYLLDTTAFKIHQLCDWRYVEAEDGNILQSTSTDKQYIATVVKYCDIICHNPRGQGKVTII